MEKNLIRQKNLALRKELNQPLASKVIVSKILAFEDFLRAKNVLIFYPMKNEINLLPLIELIDKNFYLPRVDGDNLLICPYTTNLKKSNFGVFEPCNNPIDNISNIDLVFVPCLAIDKNLNRVGYGKGYYDRLFINPDFKALKVAVINKELLIDTIFVDDFDKKVDFVITN